tara:strand:- start:50 stop:811 length:762 start_codon:yes stop_codon:yes gene_type:complete
MPAKRTETSANAVSNGVINTNAGGNWSVRRDATSGTARHAQARATINTQNILAGSKPQYRVGRYFIAFNSSSITSKVQEGTLNVELLATLFSGDVSNIRLIAVKSDEPSGGTLVDNDFNNIVGFSTGASMQGNVTIYSDIVNVTSTGTQTLNFKLTQDALDDIVSLNAFNIAIVEYDHDFLNVEPTDLGGRAVRTINNTTWSSIDLTFPSTPKQIRDFKRTIKSKGSRGRGFSAKDVVATTGGKTVTNGFGEF